MKVKRLPRLKIHRGKFPLRPMLDRLDDYIEFALNTKKFSDAGFYGEVRDYVEELENKIKSLEGDQGDE